MDDDNGTDNGSDGQTMDNDDGTATIRTTRRTYRGRTMTTGPDGPRTTTAMGRTDDIYIYIYISALGPKAPKACIINLRSSHEFLSHVPAHNVGLARKRRTGLDKFTYGPTVGAFNAESLK